MSRVATVSSRLAAWKRMYETLIMLKPGGQFSMEEMHQIVRDVATAGNASINRTSEGILLTQGTATLGISWSDAPHVTEESSGIAGEFQVPCQGCRARFEMSGNDADMDLFNDYLLIGERLQETGLFLIFDPIQGKLLFDS